MTLEQFRDKRKSLLIDEALNTIQLIYKRYGRLPSENEMAGFRILFMPRTEENLNTIKNERVLGGSKEKNLQIFKETKPLYDSYEDFIKSFGDCISVK